MKVCSLSFSLGAKKLGVTWEKIQKNMLWRQGILSGLVASCHRFHGGGLVYETDEYSPPRDSGRENPPPSSCVKVNPASLVHLYYSAMLGSVTVAVK